MMDKDTKLPLGFQPKQKQGQYYCSVGSQNAYYREVAEEHMNLCLRAGLKVSGINAEVAPCQWEYQIGPCVKEYPQEIKYGYLDG